MKPPLKRWLVALLIQIGVIIGSAVGFFFDSSNEVYYTFPVSTNGVLQHVFWYSVADLVVIVLVPIGYLLGSLFIRFFVNIAKTNKKIQYVGFARVQFGTTVQRKQMLTRIVFGVLLSINFWMLLFQYDMFPLWIRPEYLGHMYSSNGSMLNFPMVPWYWFPNAITCLLFTICFMILDSGLVYVKKVPEHPDFSDTERVGNLLWSIVKGYAGIVVILNFATIISGPLGKEASLVFYPAIAASYAFFIVTTIDIFKPWGRKLAFNVVKASRAPELITMDYKTSPVADPKDLYD